MKLAQDVRPITYLKRKPAELLASVAGNGRSVVITQNGRARAVVMEVETYETWRDALALLKLAAQGEKDLASGRATPQRRVFKDARKRLLRNRG